MDITKVTEDISNKKPKRTDNWQLTAEKREAKLPATLERPSPKYSLVKKIPGLRPLVHFLRTYSSSTILQLTNKFYDLTTLSHELAQTRKLVSDLKDQVQTLSESQSALKRKLNTFEIREHKVDGKTPKVDSANRPALEPYEWDSLYHEFEEQFRGDQDAIARKQSKYIKIFESLDKELKGKPISDFGCGRGEWLDLLTEHGFKATGSDPNQKMVEVARSKGHDVVTADCFSYFNSMKKGSLAGVTSFHVVEHIDFETLFKTLKAAYEAISEKGFILLETPNPECLVVGSCSFYMDPTHIKPIPPQALKFFVEQAGFANTEIIYSSPLKEDVQLPNQELNEIAQRFYGPQDYAVLGYKV